MAHGRLCLFGEVANGEVRSNDAGRMVERVWRELPERFPFIGLDAFVVMPNHVHGIIVIMEPENVGAGFPRPVHAHRGMFKGAEIAPLRAPALGQIVAGFKYRATKPLNTARGTPGAPLWQRGYHDRIARGPRSLDAFRRYSANNPFAWADDEENPARVPSRV